MAYPLACNRKQSKWIIWRERGPWWKQQMAEKGDCFRRMLQMLSEPRVSAQGDPWEELVLPLVLRKGTPRPRKGEWPYVKSIVSSSSSRSEPQARTFPTNTSFLHQSAACWECYYFYEGINPKPLYPYCVHCEKLVMESQFLSREFFWESNPSSFWLPWDNLACVYTTQD